MIAERVHQLTDPAIGDAPEWSVVPAIRGGRGSNATPSLRIIGKNQPLLILTAAAVALFGETPEYVQILVDARRGVIGVRRAAQTDSHRARLRKRSSGTGYMSGAALLRHYPAFEALRAGAPVRLMPDGVIAASLNDVAEDGSA